MGATNQFCRFVLFDIRELVTLIFDFDLDRTGSTNPCPANLALFERIQEYDESPKMFQLR